MRCFQYNPKSECADEFINHLEILETLDYAKKHKNDVDLCYQILEKARSSLNPKISHGSTLSPREASDLRACEDPEVNQAIKALAFR